MGRPPMFPKRLLVALTQAHLDRLDVWRAKQRGVPNRSEAIRQLIEQIEPEPPPKPKRRPRR
jgi:metal-responsive CopG/Arc/MetJ family transcriptional regulator